MVIYSKTLKQYFENIETKRGLKIKKMSILYSRLSFATFLTLGDQGPPRVTILTQWNVGSGATSHKNRVRYITR